MRRACNPSWYAVEVAEQPQLGQHGVVPAEAQLGGDPHLRCLELNLLEAIGLDPNQFTDVCQRTERPAELRSTGQQSQCRRRIGVEQSSSPVDGLLESPGINHITVAEHEGVGPGAATWDPT